jgi:hypothetical protein
LNAQDPRGTIVGRVIDRSGAVVPNLEVRATNQETSVVATGRTTSAGDYRIGFLLPGKYTISAEAAGFKKYMRPNIEVRVTETIEASFAMDLGTVSETVDVVAESPVLSTSDASQGTVIESLAVQELPLAGGNPVELALLDPATMNETDMREHRAEMTNADSQWSSMGGGSYNNEYQIDGVSNTFADGAGHARVAFNPPSSAIGQFKIITNPFDASAGNTLGATVNVSTKSGTNKFHGEGHYFGRNNFFDAMNFFSNANNIPQTVYQDNRYGGSIGGPVHLPKLYNGRGKTFFFYAWEENRYNAPQTFTGTVPTAAQRNGDFSALLALTPTTGNARDFQLYDPYTTVGNGSGAYSRQPLPGNIVPKSRFDPAGFALANLYPLPNQTGDYDGERNYFSATRSDEIHWVHILRVDHAFSESHRAFLRANYDYWDEVKNKYMPGIQGVNLNRINRGLALDDVILLNPNLVMHVRYGFTEQDFPEKRISRGADLKALGFSSNLVNLIDPTRVTLPRVSPSTYAQYSSWESGDGANTALTHDVNSDLSTQRGRHSLRLGVGYRLYRAFGSRYQYETAPDLTFGTTYVNSTNTAAAPPIGPGLASMLMGIATAGTMQHQASSALQNHFLSGYVQDDFKLRSNLTINVGLRYEIEFPMTERYDRMVTGFAYDQVNPIDAAARAAYRTPIAELPASQFKLMGGLQFVGQTPNGRAMYPVHAHNFLPRIGGAWRVSRRMTIRSGYGIYYGTLGVNSTIVQQSGFTASTPLQATVDNGISYRALVSNPYPTGLLPVTGAAGGLSTFLGQGFTAYDPNKSVPYSQRWTIAVQSLLPSQILVEAGYVGNRSTHLNTSRNINSTPLQYLSPLMSRDNPVISYLGGTVPNPMYNLGPVFTSNTISRANLLLPYPEFGAITMNDSQGFAWYHSLQVRGTRRLGHGVTVNMGYAFTKSMEAIAYLNAADTRPYRTLSASDRPHRVTSSIVWQLPIGRRRAYFSHMNKVLEAVLGNWQMSGVVIRQAGGPLTWGNIIYTGDPDQMALPKGQRSPDHWFNTTNFNKVSNQQLASNIRYFPMRLSSVRADGQSKWDISMAKTFRVRESVEFRLRTQCFNIMNHPNFAAPNLTPTAAQFGTITTTVGMPRTFQVAATLQF